MKSNIAGLPLGGPSLQSSNGNGNSSPVTATTDGHTLSPEQSAIIEWVRDGHGSAFIEALAGTGKTTILIAASREMRGSVAMAAFNKKIADEIKRKIAEAESSGTSTSSNRMRVGTFHSFGFASWRNVAPAVRVEANEKTRMMHDIIGTPWPLRSAVAQLVSLAKQSVVGKLWDANDYPFWQSIIDHYDIMLRVDDDGREDSEIAEELIHFAQRGIEWARSVAQTIIDFDDMIWLPLVENSPMTTYDWVLVDEAQDTNAARRMLARRMLREGGRLVAVGDKYQAIYGFTGADSNAVTRIIEEFKCASLPLTVTFRCSQAATRLAQTWVPHIVAHESNAEGSVIQASTSVYFHRTTANIAPSDGGLIDGFHPLAPGDAILCRNTKPLVALAFQLIREGIGAHVEGRDIGKSLERLATKWKVTSVPALIVNLESYRQKETERLVAREAKYQIEALNDRIDTLLVVTEDCDTVQQVRDKIDRLFKDTNGGGRPTTVTLSTIHRAKGREWERVFILGYNGYMPSKWARQEWEKEQERNLFYVAVTRTKRDLILTGAID